MERKMAQPVLHTELSFSEMACSGLSRFLRLLPFCLMMLFLGACATGPLMLHETARSVGKGKNELSLGYGIAGYAFKWSHGVSEDFDLGVQLESMSWGVRGKYSLVNARTHGWSIAIGGGAGGSSYSKHIYGDFIVSHLADKWEPYGSLRVVHVTWDPLEFHRKNGELLFVTPSDRFRYGQAILGTRYWTNQKTYLMFEASTLLGFESGVRWDSGMFLSAGVGGRF
ncbi:MAG: hypothetical protein RBT63_10345 [Bdellovibrionales bacterium]|jgi:hypothetical protein|nr:hypothetical protein [Bdellovibrionales bacterium]